MSKAVFVTGGNSGIGLALCKQLAAENDCYVYLGSRSVERGEEAKKTLGEEVQDKIEVVQCDINSAESVANAAQYVSTRGLLYGLVNNAGVGLAHGVPADAVIDTNLYGTKTMTDAFLPLISPGGGRIVSVGSGAGPMWLEKQSPEVQGLFTKEDITWEELDAFLKEHRNEDAMYAYGCSKSALSAWTVALANQHPKLVISSITPGFIDTAITAGWGAGKTPEEGTVSIRHALLDEVAGSGFYFGSDAIRSPFYPGRNPGEKPFDGTYPWSKE